MSRQFADDSMTPPPITVTKDRYGNEIAQDRTSHTNTTAGEGEFHWDEGHYSTDFNAGYSGYGTNVQPPQGVDKVTVDNSRADRGKES